MTDVAFIASAITDFKRLLADARETDLGIVQSRVSAGLPCVFRLNPELYRDLRAEIASHFSIHPMDTLMIGSGHLGFSLAPDKLWRPFGPESDLDMVIISDRVFVEFWQQLSDYDQSHARSTVREQQDPENEFAAYYKYVFQNTSSRLARVTRGRLIESYMQNLQTVR